MFCASATVIVAVAVALGAQAERFELADVQQDARQDAAEHAHEMKRAAEKREQQREEASRSTPRPAVPSGSPKAYARSLVPAGQFSCLDKLWTRESGWRWNARNPSSGAYGIPQSLPGSKMSSAGADWRTNPRTQVRWGIGYIKSRYGTPCGAWAHSQQTGWY